MPLATSFVARVERVGLSGSHAHGNADAASIYGVAVLSSRFSRSLAKVERIIPVVTDVLYEDAASFHAMPSHAGAYRDGTPLMGRGYRAVTPERRIAAVSAGNLTT